MADGSAVFGEGVQRGADWIQFGASFGNNYTPADMDKVIDTISPTGPVVNKNTPQTTNINLINDGHDFFSSRTLTDLGRVGSRLYNGDTLMGSDSTKMTQRINDMAKGGNKNAQAFINATDRKSRSRALATLLKENKADLADVSGRLTEVGSSASVGNYDSFLDDVDSEELP
jgi:hypothetical protein